MIDLKVVAEDRSHIFNREIREVLEATGVEENINPVVIEKDLVPELDKRESQVAHGDFNYKTKCCIQI